MQISHVASQFFLTFFLLAHWLIFLAHLVSPHTSRHEEGPALARARPGDLESEELSRLALVVDVPPPGTQQMRSSSSTCIAEDERLDPLCHTPQTRWAAERERPCKGCPGRHPFIRPVISPLKQSYERR